MNSRGATPGPLDGQRTNHGMVVQCGRKHRPPIGDCQRHAESPLASHAVAVGLSSGLPGIETSGYSQKIPPGWPGGGGRLGEGSWRVRFRLNLSEGMHQIRTAKLFSAGGFNPRNHAARDPTPEGPAGLSHAYLFRTSTPRAPPDSLNSPQQP